MDKTSNSSTKRDWAWLGAHMPRVVALLREYREVGEGDHLDECWLRGVMRGEPGWFWAVEGPIRLGTPFEAPPVVSTLGELERRAFELHGVLLMMAPLPGGPYQPPTSAGRAARALQELAA